MAEGPPPVLVTFSSYQLRTESRGFEALAALHEQIDTHSAKQIAIDCGKLHWFDAHLAAPLRTVLSHGQSRSNSFRLVGLKPEVHLALRKNRLLNQHADDSFHTSIPVTLFRLDEEITFAEYSRKHLARNEMPTMSAPLKSKFFEAIDELFANCALHSQSPIHVVAAGQFYPRNHRLAFSISDGGRGIDGSLKHAGIPYGNAADAINWAMTMNNTTRQGDIPGGLGLKLLCEFVGKNGGRLTIVSGSGYWCQNGSVVEKSVLRKRFPGTSVILEISTSDKNKYDLARAPRPEDIW
ncbi:ATP-binding protein [Mesorhizobium sangaii]|uniref:Anti-anti-sigma regulatory factor n=1 Tax=Mesorhizobium sangaii TaxID=505389 RepID=A0A841PCP9_9HYPH|nr:ATP-binding protein [Mesorhizobium sangaii]MBB6407669.1 anti-anti-sigma regulatory factor [Mesorhizobium sangaii]